MKRCGYERGGKDRIKTLEEFFTPYVNQWRIGSVRMRESGSRELRKNSDVLLSQQTALKLHIKKINKALLFLYFFIINFVVRIVD